MAWLKRRGSKLYIEYATPGTKHIKRISTGLEVGQKRQAQQVLAEWERLQVEGVEAPAVAEVLTVEAWGAQWLEERKARGKLDWINEQGHLRYHLYPALGARPLTEVTKAEMLEWVHGLPAHRRHDGKPGRLSPRSVHKYAETTRLLFKAAAKRDLIPVNPCVWDASDLPPKEDSDPTRAREGGFSAEQVGWLIGDALIPEDRRLLYALEFLTGMRTGEAADRRWRDWEPTFKGDLGRLVAGTSWNTRHRIAKPTKTRVVKWIPVHPELDALLRDWKREGWARAFGRTPAPDDLIVPASRGGARNNSYSWRLWAEHDLPELGLAHQRHYESRSTFRSLARAGGAKVEDLDLITHPSPRAAKDLYNRTGQLWPLMCAAVRCVRVTPAAKPKEGPLRVTLLGAVGGVNGYSGTGTPPDEPSRIQAKSPVTSSSSLMVAMSVEHGNRIRLAMYTDAWRCR